MQMEGIFSLHITKATIFKNQIDEIELYCNLLSKKVFGQNSSKLSTVHSCTLCCPRELVNLLIYFFIILGKFTTNKTSSEMLPIFRVIIRFFFIIPAKIIGSGGIRTRAYEQTGALNQRLRPLGHATFLQSKEFCKIHFRRFSNLKFFEREIKTKFS